VGYGVIDWIFPSICRECSVFIPKNSIFCSNCSERIKPVYSTTISVKNTKIPIFAISRYEGAIKKLVLRKKRTLFQMSADKLVSRQLGQLIYEKTTIREISFDFIVPIPLHWTRYLWRGFNQSYEMARVISKRTGIPVACVLRRVKRTTFQSNLSSNQRDKNVKNIFVIKNKHRLDNLLHDKSILIIDDLYTTGATLKNAVRPLIECGVRKIVAAVACRV
jgi:ComF family protein